ncbi:MULTISPECIES: hypothetical protein [Methanoculleus]|jgi:hypothetical protein|uniref:Uncharacterized protein n=1 Tax=Methanoculleus thermophilus TaxID=2200 RepID=A0A1G8WME8_9EURY|nr:MULTISPECIES: hypothetical protein [Methanoculleus]NLN09376.1 hypothetical protein [Methanoculleus thermophilus]SDJ79287.1 hypothetical protein SAMN04488571_1014 [Methanoculleus thermophilus]HQD26037.1 hypothetical protein [Methanoculleus thermophilus]
MHDRAVHLHPESHLAVLTLRFYPTFVHRTRCYHCGKEADQIVKAVSAQAQVICSACAATRIFVPRFENSRGPGVCTPIGCYDVWTIEADGRCKKCGVEGSHGLVIGCNHFTTRCRNCDMHFYRFNLEYTATSPIEDVNAPRGPS